MIELPPDTPPLAREPLRALLDAEPPALDALEGRVEAYQAWAVAACRGRAFEELEQRTSLAAACAVLLRESQEASREGARLARAVVAYALDRTQPLVARLGALGALCLELGRPDLAPRAALQALAPPQPTSARRWLIRVVSFALGLGIAYVAMRC